MDNINFTNQILIAMPNLHDPNFAKSVTYICEHNQEGAMGIMLNRPMGIKLGEVFQHMKLPITEEQTKNIPVHFGGPVQTDRGFVLHDPIGDWESTLVISEHLGLTTSQDIIAGIALGKCATYQQFIALGYAGWGPGQLEKEMHENIWINCPAEPRLLFHTPIEKRWHTAAESLGFDINLLSSTVGHA